MELSAELIKDVTEKFSREGWSKCTWEHPGYFEVSQGRTLFQAGVPDSTCPMIQVDLMQDWNCITSWAIPYHGELTAQKIIERINAAIEIFETEEIDGVILDDDKPVKIGSCAFCCDLIYADDLSYHLHEKGEEILFCSKSCAEEATGRDLP